MSANQLFAELQDLGLESYTTYTVLMRATNNAGKTSDVFTRNFTIETEAPHMNSELPASAITLLRISIKCFDIPTGVFLFHSHCLMSGFTTQYQAVCFHGDRRSSFKHVVNYLQVHMLAIKSIQNRTIRNIIILMNWATEIGLINCFVY